jgi:hypothetical protein
MKTVDTGGTWVHVQAIYVLIVNHFQYMTVAANKNIGFFLLQFFTSSVVVSWGITTNVRDPNFHTVQHKLLVERIAAPHGMVVDVSINGNKGLS